MGLWFKDLFAIIFTFYLFHSFEIALKLNPWFSIHNYRAVTDPRDGRRVALKKLPNVFQSLVSSKRVFRELKMLCFFKHENVSTFLHYKWVLFKCIKYFFQYKLKVIQGFKSALKIFLNYYRAVNFTKNSFEILLNLYYKNYVRLH